MRKDNVGWAYGAYQFNSKAGSLNSFLKNTKYGEMFEGLTPETKEFNNRWKSIAESDPDFGKAQYDFAKKEHYDVLNNRVTEAFGTDISKKGRAVQEMLFSTSIQYEAYTNVINNALKGKDIDSLSDQDIINLVQDYKYDNANTLFSKNNGKDAEAQRKNRIPQEKEMLLAISEAEAAKLNEDTPPKPASDKAAPSNIPKLAIGHDYIPYDGYQAELHKGEAVLPKFLAEKWRSGREDADVSPIKRLLENLVSSSTPVAERVIPFENSLPFNLFNDLLAGTNTSVTSTQNVNLNISGKIQGMDKDNQGIVSSALRQYYAPDKANSNKGIMSMLKNNTVRRRR